MQLLQGPPDIVPGSIAPSSVASIAPSSIPSPPPGSVISSPESIPPQLSTTEPAPAAKPTKTRAGSSQPPVVETPVAAAPPPPPPVDRPPPESATFQAAPEAPVATPPPSSQNSSPSFWIPANNSPAPTSNSKPKAPPAPVSTISYPDPRASQTKQEDYTTFRTIANAPTSAAGPKSSSTSNAQATKASSSVIPESTASKGTGVIASSPFDIPSTSHGPAKASKSNASTVGGVIGGLTAATLLGLLLFFLWKWRARRIARANERFSFGPCGNGIDASTGNVLVASVPRPEDGSPPLAPMTEKYGYIPPPRTRYFQPAVDNGRMLLRPIDSIEELSERGSGDATRKVGFAGTNPFDDKHAIDRLEPTLPSINLPDEIVESPAGSGRGSPSLQANSRGAWVPPKMNPGNPENGQERYKTAPITPMRRYPTNPIGARGPMGRMQRNRRSRSVSGIKGYPQLHNPVMNSPGWNRSAPMASSPGRRPSLPGREANVPVASSPTSVQSRSPPRKASVGSLRERPSPTNWMAPDTAHPLHQFPQPPQHPQPQRPQPHQPQPQQAHQQQAHQQQPLARSNTQTMRLGPIDRGPDLTFGNMWGTTSSNIDSKSGDPARNF